ncbi:MAG: methyltransferase domain-containing protein [Candidatus Buchananbacteria bacterium]|nr:methyltransferase domain-containing protein [Candidatus Buchananbacteria bacterium]
MREIHKKERDFHDKWADLQNIDDIGIDSFFEATTALENKYIINQISKAGGLKDKKILDVGCGLGESAIYFAQKGANVIAIDTSSGMLNFTDKLAKNKDIAERLELLVMSADDDWPWVNQFDYIYAANVFHHVANKKTFLQNINQALKPGGSFFIWDPLKYNPIINIYRTIAQEVRTVDESPIGRKDVSLIKKYFTNIEIHYFWLLTLIIFVKYFLSGIDPNKERYWKRIYREKSMELHWWRKLEYLDHFLCRTPFLKWLCWNIVIYGKK